MKQKKEREKKKEEPSSSFFPPSLPSRISASVESVPDHLRCPGHHGHRQPLLHPRGPRLLLEEAPHPQPLFSPSSPRRRHLPSHPSFQLHPSHCGRPSLRTLHRFPYKIANVEPSTPSCAASCSTVCSTSTTVAEASPPLLVCTTCGILTTSVASSPPWIDAYNPPAYHPIRMLAINAPTQTNAIILAPIPQPLPIPCAIPPYDFQTPTKHISSPDDIHRFHSSASGYHFLGFVIALSHSIHGRKIFNPVPPSLKPSPPFSPSSKP